jgi:SAM-dependent methyltransferase
MNGDILHVAHGGFAMSKYARAQDMDSWLEDPRIAERGFAHRWESSVTTGNGEDAFLSLVDQHLRPDSDLLDFGCGHGELTLNLAARCRSIAGIDRDSEYLKLARELAIERGAVNVQFIEVDLAQPDEEESAFVEIPFADDSIDLFINRRGPVLRCYLSEAIRIARAGASIVGLHPTGNTPAPTWRDELPRQYYDVFIALPFEEVTGWVTKPLDAAGISDYSLWWVDVPEILRNPHELYVRFSAGHITDVPDYSEVAQQLEAIFQHHATSDGVLLRHQRLLWKVNIPK